MATSIAELIFRITPQGGADFKSTMAQVRSEFKQTEQTQRTVSKSELSTRQQLAAASSLQRQRSAALIGEWKRTETAAANLAKGVAPVSQNLQKITDIMQALGSSSATLQGPMGGVAGRLRALGAVASEAGGGLGLAGAGLLGLVAAVALAQTVGVVVLTKQFLDLVGATAEFQGKMFDLSQQVGISTETLSALEVVAKTTGGNIDSLTASLGIFQRHLEEAQDPASKSAEAFKQLGVDATNTEDALRQTIKSLAEMPEGFAQTAAALEVFGRGGKAFLAIAKESNGDLDGLIARLKTMGLIISTDTAKAADEFNDQLALVQFQIRGMTAALVQDAIPAILESVRAVSNVLTENREAIVLLGNVVGIFVDANIKAIVLPALQTLALVLGSIRDAWLGTRVAALVALKQYAAAGAVVAEFNSQMQKIQGISPAAAGGLGAGPIGGGLGGKTIAEVKAEADEIARISKDALSKVQIDFEQGKATAAQVSAITLAGIAKEKAARLDALDAEIAIKKQEYDAQKGNAEKGAKIAAEITKLAQDQLNVRSEFSRRAAEEENRALQEQNKNVIQHLEARQNIQQKAADSEIKLIRARVEAGELAAEAGEAAIAAIEQSGFDDRRRILQQELNLKGLSLADRERINARLAELESEITENQREQSQRRNQITRDEFDERLRLVQQAGDRELQLRAATDDLLIAREEALAAAGLKTHQDAARAILAIRIAGIKAEIDLLGDRRAAAVALPDQKKGDELEAQLIHRQKILQKQLERIQLDGNTAVEAGRQKDLENAQNYADELTRIAGDAVEGVKGALARAAQEGGVFDSLTEFLKGGGFASGTNGILDMTKGIEEFGATAMTVFTAVLGATQELSKGVGQLVANWVLMGSAAEINMGKLVATVLAGVAAQAATLAVFEFALAIAALTPFGSIIYGTAAQHFQAAALFASIAAVSAVAGRAVAGNSFASSGGGGGSGGGGSFNQGGSGSGGNGSPAPISLGSQRGSSQVHLTIKHEFNTPLLKDHVTNIVVTDAGNAGPVRDVIVREIKRWE